MANRGNYENSELHKTIKEKKAIQSDRRFVAGELKTGFSILGIVFLLILCAVLIRRFNYKNDIPTFEGLLTYLTQTQVYNFPFVDFASFGGFANDWGILNVLRNFLANFANLINVVIFLVNGLMTIVQYVLILMRWLFVF